MAGGGITRRTFLKAGAAGIVAARLGVGSMTKADSACCCNNIPELKTGIPLGGIGAGTVEIRQDGLFREWQIFGNWRMDEMKLDIENAFFAVHVKPANDAPTTRILATESRAGLVPVDHIIYCGEFPNANLKYFCKDSPCIVFMNAWSPFIPHDAKNSALPVAVFEFVIANSSRANCEASIVACLQNMVGYTEVGARRLSKIAGGNGWHGIEMSAENVSDGVASKGSMVLAALGDDAKANAGGYPEDVLAGFKAYGSVEERSSASGSIASPLVGAVSQKVELKPGEMKKITFFMTWYFPCFIDAEKLDIGRMYSNWFGSAGEVADYLVDNMEMLADKTRRFHNLYYGASLPRWLVDAVNAQFTTAFKSSWWTRDNTFAIWEGLACCGSQTLDVAYYGSFPIIMFFPELAKQAMRLTAKFQNASGRIPHFFPGTFQYPDAYHMIDLMPKFTLMVWRDYLWTGDRDYLDEMWPHVRKAMEHNRALDRNGDFLPDNHDIDQTYDGWEFEGASIYVGLINTVAYRAAAKIAHLQGEDELAVQYERLAALGAGSLDDLLWNGEHYDLFYDITTDTRDKCCMADQMNGAWYAQVLELGDILPRERKLCALKSILKYNRGHDYIRNGAWTEGGPDHGGQWSAVWSGTEYMLASHMIYEGMVDEGLGVAKMVYDRYYKDGMIWNHCECGEHYYRAMVVLMVLLAVQGFHYSAPEKRLAIDPKIQRENHIAPFVTPSCWGKLSFRETGEKVRIEIELDSGEMELSCVEIGGVNAGQVEVKLGNKRVQAQVENVEDKMVVKFAGVVLVGVASPLVVLLK